MLNVTIPRDLVSITLAEWEKVYKKCTLEDAKKWKSEKRDFTLIDWSSIAYHQIFRLEKATDLEEFEVYVLHTLSKTARDDFEAIKKTALQLKLKPSLNAILWALRKKKEDREYELTVNRNLSESELERRRQQVANRPKLQFS